MYYSAPELMELRFGLKSSLNKLPIKLQFHIYNKLCETQIQRSINGWNQRRGVRTMYFFMRLCWESICWRIDLSSITRRHKSVKGRGWGFRGSKAGLWIFLVFEYFKVVGIERHVMWNVLFFASFDYFGSRYIFIRLKTSIFINIWKIKI